MSHEHVDAHRAKQQKHNGDAANPHHAHFVFFVGRSDSLAIEVSSSEVRPDLSVENAASGTEYWELSRAGQLSFVTLIRRRGPPVVHECCTAERIFRLRIRFETAACMRWRS
jgi:hypothetical protein